MSYLVLCGLLLAILAGFLQGTSVWPFKITKDICLEKFLLFNVGTAFVLIPWTIAFLWLDVPKIFQSLDLDMFLRSLLFSAGWGIANVLYLICVIKIGAALTGAILFALGMSVSMIMPMILKGSGIFEKSPDLMTIAGILVVVSIVVIVLGVLILTIAGFGREKALSGKSELERQMQASGSFIQGLILVCIAGVLSAGLSLSFIYTQDNIINAAKEQGMSKLFATPVAWSIGAMGGIIVNLIFAFFLLIKNKTLKTIFARKDEALYGFCSGFQWFVSLLCYGLGMIYLGPLGGAIGSGIQQAVSLLSNQLVGFWGGEWKGVHGRPRQMMFCGIVIILIAIVIMSLSNQLAVDVVDK
ncbi:MAG: L-rhamnose/proton symporter RhaT [Planctomycetia bacterium]|nr:L-rhamnose/proton symporter RhaT [Planctomycetia bacterium]